jgi:hypothetical protein
VCACGGTGGWGQCAIEPTGGVVAAVAEAIDVLSEGFRVRGARDERFRRAAALWNLACYRTLMNVRIMTAETTRSIIEKEHRGIRL